MEKAEIEKAESRNYTKTKAEISQIKIRNCESSL
jgi:hypothetical protein